MDYITLYVKLSAVMLKLLRTHTKTIVWIVVGSFLLWGGYSVTTLKKEGRYAGEVFGKAVTFQDFNVFSRATQLFMPSEQPLEDADLVRAYTWQNIIFSREAKREGVKISDEDVRNEIAKILTQQGISNPTQEQYRIWLARSLQISPSEFEEGLREFMRIQKLIQSKISSFALQDKISAASSEEEKAKFAVKQRESFIAWTDEVNARAKIKDYLALTLARNNSVEVTNEVQAIAEPITSEVKTDEKTNP